MTSESKAWDFLDILSILSFVIGVANYDENIDQSQLQDVAMSMSKDLHEHLQMQDDKIDRILELLSERRKNNAE